MFDERDLALYYQTNFKLMYFHKYSLADIEGMYPFERMAYIQLIVHQLEMERKERERGR